MNTAADPLGHPHLVVCRTAPLLDTVVVEHVAAGWQVVGSEDIEATTRLGSTDGRLAVLPALCEQDIESVLDMLEYGMSVAVAVADDIVAARLFDQARRLVPTAWFDDAEPPLTEGLDPTHIQLLCSLAAGDSVGAAALAAHLSERTASRRLEEARAVLGVRSNAEAARVVAGHLNSLRPRGA